jgi:hypothetical protein
MERKSTKKVSWRLTPKGEEYLKSLKDIKIDADIEKLASDLNLSPLHLQKIFNLFQKKLKI